MPLVIPNRSLVFLAALTALLLPATAVQGAAGTTPADAHDHRPSAGSDVLAQDFQRDIYDGNNQFVGADGVTYQSAPVAVPGLDGELFYGADFDVACGLGGAASSAMRKVTKLARMIEASGRTVIWTAGPSKTSVLNSKIDWANLPHGNCDKIGLDAQRHYIDHVKDPTFLPLRRRLAYDPRQVYFKSDPHWTTVGASVFAKQVALRLSAKVARKQRYVYGTETRNGLFNSLRGIDAPETAETALPDGKVVIRTAKSSVEDWPGYPAITFDHSWNTRPAKSSVAGHTLLLGDSFMLYALASMRPIFHHGRFMWVDHVDVDDVVKAIKHSDTVVMEVLQTFLPLNQILVSSKFRKQVKRALDVKK
jgi:hypothetical protein